MQYYKSTSTGVPYYFEDDVTVSQDSKGQNVFKNSLGTVLPVPKDLVLFTPDILTDAGQLKRAIQLKSMDAQSECGNTISKGFTYNNVLYPSDTISQNNIRDASVSSGGTLWCSSDNGETWQFKEHTAEECTNVRIALFNMVQAAQKVYADKLTALNQCTTVAEVEAIK